MEQSKVQFVVCHAHPDAPGRLDSGDFLSIQIGADSLVPVTALDASGQPLHTLQAGKTPVSLLGYSAESGLGRILRETRFEAMENVATQTVFTAHLASVLRTMVLEGRGVAWLPQTLVHDDLASGRVVEAGVPALRVPLEIRLFRSRNSMGRAAEALWDAVARAGEVTC